VSRLACGAVMALLVIVSTGLRAPANVLRIPLDGSINPMSRDFVVRGLREAEESGAALVVIELDTPGGLVDSTRDIVAAELASTVPVAVFVGPSGARAASAGTFITLAADIAAMAPGTNIGAAHPVSLIGSSGDEGDEEQGSSTSAEKAAQDASAFARSIAEARGRNVAWAEAAVLESLSITAEEALAQDVIDLIADDFDDLLARLDGYVLSDGRTLALRGLGVDTLRPTLRERLLGLLADPNLVYVLFILGLYGLIYEFFHPGIGFGLAAGGVCLVLALFGLQVLPVNIVGVILILFGIALVILDAFTPANGILTAGGVVALLFGSLALFDIPDRRFGLSWVTILSVIGVTAALSAFVLSKGLLIQRRRPVTGGSALLDAIGTVRRDLDPEGMVFVRGEYWSARSLEGDLPVGTSVRVVAVERGTLHVRAVSSQDTDIRGERR
jgi:membrane-bound serine protease (ClpP class)